MRWRLVPRTRWGWIRMVALLSLLPLLFVAIWLFTVKMPGRPFAGPLEPLTADQRALEARLGAHVRVLAGQIGERSAARYEAVQQAAAYLDSTFQALGYPVRAQDYAVRGRVYQNLEAEVRGVTQPEEIVVVGAHYDSAEDAPGADDNASGVAGMLELARTFAGSAPARTLRFVAFANEEPPSFPTADMGSRHYADAAAARGERVVAMLSIESIGYYDETPGSQRYPFPLNLAYPDRGDFIGFVSNLRSRPLLRRAIAAFRDHAQFPTQGAAAPWWVPGVWWSDHWAFWRKGFAAIMITDTAPYRNVFYHTAGDTPSTLDYDRMARVVDGLVWVVRDLAGEIRSRSRG
ncbi:MAG: M20/M25/M40 family metallo-hydrolase [Gemmatimonadales bacterium]